MEYLGSLKVLPCVVFLNAKEEGREVAWAGRLRPKIKATMMRKSGYGEHRLSKLCRWRNSWMGTLAVNFRTKEEGDHIMKSSRTRMQHQEAQGHHCVLDSVNQEEMEANILEGFILFFIITLYIINIWYN